MLLTYDQYANIPEKIHEFYQAAFEVLYSRHDATKGGFTREMNTSLTSSEFKNILSFISIVSYLKDQVSFSEDELSKYIEKAKKQEEIEFNESNFIDDLIESVCILVKDGLKYKYSHKSFQEYFTSKYIESCGDEEQKQILKKIYKEKTESILQDSVFAIIFDKNKSIIEKNFLIPVLNELKNKINSDNKNEIYINYLKYRFNDVGIDFTLIGEQDIKTEVDAISYSINMKTQRLYKLITFIKNNYESNIPYKKLNFEKVDEIKKLKEYGTYDETKAFVGVDLNEVEANTELSNEIILLSPNILSRFEYTMLVLEELEKKYKRKKHEKETLFGLV